MSLDPLDPIVALKALLDVDPEDKPSEGDERNAPEAERESDETT